MHLLPADLLIAQLVSHDLIYEILEARVGIEPTHKGFADLSLTAWVPRPGQEILIQAAFMKPVR